MQERDVLPREVIKRDGRIVSFDSTRIALAVGKAIQATEGRSYLEAEQGKDLLDKIVSLTLAEISGKYSRQDKPHVEDIQDIVEHSLMRLDLYEIARAYVLYRKEREKVRDEKMRMLGRKYTDEVDKAFSLNAIKLLVSRYLLRDEGGKLIEGPKEMFQRVAALIVISDILHDAVIFDVNGGQMKHSGATANLESIVSKIRADDPSTIIPWNKYHLERMYELYKALNEKGQMRIPWEDFVEQLVEGVFKAHENEYVSYYDIMVQKKFLPNSPTLFNAGTRLGQLSACFVIPIEDNIESIMEAASDCAAIFKSGGGVGINYSSLRPEGDVVASTGGVASGPVSFMRIIDTVTDVVKQGGKRRGANMGILDISHPDVQTFVRSKQEAGRFENFNISVMIPPEFWRSYEQGSSWPLTNPRDGKVWKSENAKHLFREIVSMAWNSADPGIVFLDNINRHNPLRNYWGDIRCTNPCGEEPMYPYESCNLGSVNLFQFVRREVEEVSLDWEELGRCIETSTRFLDNVIDVNLFPVKEIEKVSKETRRIGLGLMGLADALYALGIPYNGEEGFAFMNRLAEFFAYHSTSASIALSTERGSFPLFQDSSYKSGELPFDAFYDREHWMEDWASISERIKAEGIRNSHTLTIAPTGSISMIADVSSGLEPQFALVFEKHVTVGSFYYTDPELERELTEKGIFNDKTLKVISENGGSLQGLEGYVAAGSDGSIGGIFLVAYDIPWWDHVRAQFEMQKWISASVSKTINMPSWATEEDIEKAYLFAYKLGLRGVTVYRDGSKDAQVLRTPSQRREKYEASFRNDTIEMMRKFGIEPPVEEISLPRKESSSERQARTAHPALEAIPPYPSSESSSMSQIPKCPNCGGRNVVSQEGCRKCLDCGWSTCTVA